MMRQDHHYDECGLDNVILQGLPIAEDETDLATIVLPNINALHQLLVAQVAAKIGALQPAELRFLRTEMGLTQAQLAALVGQGALSIGRWERGETAALQSAEMIMRIGALQQIDDPITL